MEYMLQQSAQYLSRMLIGLDGGPSVGRHQEKAQKGLAVATIEWPRAPQTASSTVQVHCITEANTCTNRGACQKLVCTCHKLSVGRKCTQFVMAAYMS